MPLTWSSAVTVMASFAAVYASLLIGLLGDKSFPITKKFGERKPWLLVVWPVIVASWLSMFILPGSVFFTRRAIQANFLICSMTFSFANAIFQSVFNAWFIESCEDREYVKIATWVFNFSNLVGYVCGLAFCRDAGGKSTKSYTALVAIVSVVGTFFLLLVCWLIPNLQQSNSEENGGVKRKTYLLSSFRMLIRRREYESLLVNRVLVSAANICSNEFFVFAVFVCFPSGNTHLNDTLGIHYLYSSVASVISVILIVVLQFFILETTGSEPQLNERGRESTGRMSLVFRELSLRWDKLDVYKALTLLFAALSIVIFVILLPNATADGRIPFSSDRILFKIWIALMICTSCVYSCMAFIEQLLVRDLLIVDAWSTGLRRANLYQATLNIPSQVISNIFASIFLSIFASTGFTVKPVTGLDTDDIHTRYTWTSGSRWQIVCFSSLLFGLLAVVSWWLFRSRFPFSQDDLNKIGKNYRSSPAGAIRSDEDDWIMNNFSKSEIAIMETDSSDKPLNWIQRLHWCNLCTSLVAAAATLAALVVHLGASSKYQVLLANLFCATTFFFAYEFLRFQPIRDLRGTSLQPMTLRPMFAKQALLNMKEKEERLASVLESECQIKNYPKSCVDDNGTSSSHAAVTRGYTFVFLAEAVIACVGLIFALAIPPER